MVLVWITPSSIRVGVIYVGSCPADGARPGTSNRGEDSLWSCPFPFAPAGEEV